MDLLLLMYGILAGISAFAFILTVIIIAGKDILYAFYRRFTVRGSDIFLIDNNRQVRHLYKFAKDGKFIIDGKLYITNPNKQMGISDDMVQEVKNKLNLRNRNIKSNIEKLDKNLNKLTEQLNNLDAKDTVNVNAIQQHIQKINERIIFLKSRLEQRENNFYMARRGTYFYIEDDPIPKDFYELYTELDSTYIQNLIMRAQSKDPKDLKPLEKTLNIIKWACLGALIAGAIGAFFALKNNTMLGDIGRNLGVVFQI